MQTFRSVVHLSFDAGAAFFYAGSIAVALAAAAFLITQILAVGLIVAAISFASIAAIWSRTLWRRYRSNSRAESSQLFAH
jgi:hypothetical protein